MLVRAHLRYLRIAPRKVRLVIGLVRGLSVEAAIDQLSVLPKRASLPVLKLLNSAVANAEHNFKLDRKELIVKSIVANEGPRLKRYQPRAFGRAAEILKRTTHITIVLEDKAQSKPQATKPVAAKPVDLTAAEVKQAPIQPKAAPAKKSPTTKKSSTAKSKARDAADKQVRRSGTE